MIQQKNIVDDIEKAFLNSGLVNEFTKYTLEQLKQIWKQIKRIEKEKSFINYNYYYNRNQTKFPLIKSAEDEPIGNSTYAINVKLTKLVKK